MRQPTWTSLVTQILDSSRRVHDGRTYKDVLTTLVEEVGELATEIAIDSGHKVGRDEGPDGIVGEALDVIVAAVDMIYVAHQAQARRLSSNMLTDRSIEMLLMETARRKLLKWEDQKNGTNTGISNHSAQGRGA